MGKINSWQGWLLSLAALACLMLGDPQPLSAADAGAVFTPGPPLQVARDLFNLATLPDGKVALFGGEAYGSGLVANVEILDPATGQSTLFDMGYQRYFPAFTKLADGNYLLDGGTGSATPGEIFHPGANNLTLTTHNDTWGRRFANAATLTSGKVLLAGGDATMSSAYGEIFDPSTDEFNFIPNHLNSFRALPLVLPCNDGNAVVMGGFSPENSEYFYEQVEEYYPDANMFLILQEHLFPDDPGWSIMGYSLGLGVYARKSAETQRLKDGRYLLLAKKMGFNTYTLFTFDPATKAIAKFPITPDLSASFILSYCPVVDAARGKAYLLTTDSPSGVFFNVRLYTVDLATGRRNDPTGSFPLSETGFSLFGVTLLADGRLFLAGGAEIVGLDYQSVKKTWFINPNRSPIGSMGLLLLD